MSKTDQSWVTILTVNKSLQASYAAHMLHHNHVPVRTKKNPLDALLQIVTLFITKATIEIQVPQEYEEKGRTVLKILNILKEEDGEADRSDEG